VGGTWVPPAPLDWPHFESARTLLTRLDLERHRLAAGEGVEIEVVVKAAAVEEVLLPILGGDEAETAV